MSRVNATLPIIGFDAGDRELFYLLYLLEHILAYTTDRAEPVIRQCLKGSAGSNTTVRITLLRIVDISARAALIFGRFI